MEKEIVIRFHEKATKGEVFSILEVLQYMDKEEVQWFIRDRTY